MNEQQQHEMVLEKTHPSGAQEWYCPTCGRRFVFGLAPTYNMTILEPGDQYARHSGSTGGLRIGAVQVAQEDEAASPWAGWLDEVDFGDW